MSDKVLPGEEPLEPDLRICDPHHHLWDLPAAGSGDGFGPHRTFLPAQLVAGFDGHRVSSTICVEAGTVRQPDFPEHLAPVGETAFAARLAATVPGGHGAVEVCRSIVARVDLRGGDLVGDALDAHTRAAGGRLCGIRQLAAVDVSGSVPDFGLGIAPGLYAQPDFRRGLALLADRGLVFDAWLYHPQLADVAGLARACPGQQIVLDHVGTPLGIGAYADRGPEIFRDWRNAMQDLASLENVAVKLGGMGMFMLGLHYEDGSSAALAKAWAPYVETCIELFGARRCMFESNYPVDGGVARYGVIWNAFKRIAAGCSVSEKAALFHGTAERVYRLADRPSAAALQGDSPAAPGSKAN